MFGKLGDFRRIKRRSEAWCQGIDESLLNAGVNDDSRDVLAFGRPMTAFTVGTLRCAMLIGPAGPKVSGVSEPNADRQGITLTGRIEVRPAQV